MAKLDDQQVRSIRIIRKLPRWGRSEDGVRLPVGIVGSTIVGFGAAPNELDLDGGGLVIDYRQKGTRKVRRVVLEFNELGMRLNAEL